MASKADMTPEEREAKEQEEFSTGPLRWIILTPSGFPPINSLTQDRIGFIRRVGFGSCSCNCRVLTDSVKNNTQVLINCRWVFAEEKARGLKVLNYP